jgi:hypothetical protein
LLRPIIPGTVGGEMEATEALRSPMTKEEISSGQVPSRDLTSTY